ncbi:MAG: alpha/beta hydrolase family protein [Terriglobales bacterium]
MRGYAQWIERWERRLAARDRAKLPRPFDWGWDWLRATPVDGLPARPQGLDDLAAWNRRVLADSAAFYVAPPARDYRLRDGWLTFTSPVPGPFPENNRVEAQWFPTARPGRPERRVVIVLPQWNADITGHLGLCRLFQRFGVAALRLSLPYHDRRLPAGLARAEYAVDSNLGRTIHAARQAVCDLRAALDWLQQQGAERLGVMGTSLGSCYAFLATAHEPRLSVNIFNHVSDYFGDVVWTGLTTGHVRAGIDGQLDQSGLREAWRAISPASFYARLVGAPKRHLLLCARYDLSFLPAFSRRVLAAFRERGIPHEAHWLPCGHYTVGQPPFKYWDAYCMIRFLRAWL